VDGRRVMLKVIRLAPFRDALSDGDEWSQEQLIILARRSEQRGFEIEERPRDRASSYSAGSRRELTSGPQLGAANSDKTGTPTGRFQSQEGCLKRTCTCLAGKGSAVRIPIIPRHAPPTDSELKLGTRIARVLEIRALSDPLPNVRGRRATQNGTRFPVSMNVGDCLRH
jgi:hypothetical protein